MWAQARSWLFPLVLFGGDGGGHRMRRGGLRIEFAQDAVVYPVLIPPLDRVDLHAIDLHSEMDVDAAG